VRSPRGNLGGIREGREQRARPKRLQGMLVQHRAVKNVRWLPLTLPDLRSLTVRDFAIKQEPSASDRKSAYAERSHSSGTDGPSVPSSEVEDIASLCQGRSGALHPRVTVRHLAFIVIRSTTS
jgi:hypothetical protein